MEIPMSAYEPKHHSVPCTVCGKTLQVSKVVYLPAFWATPLSTVIPAFWATPPYYSHKEPMTALLIAI